MKTKMIVMEVDRCGACPWSDWNLCDCTHPHADPDECMPVDLDYNAIPDNCPLPDKDENDG